MLQPVFPVKNTKPKKPRKVSDLNFLRRIVRKYVLEHAILWPRDLAFAKKLYEKYPDQKFWNLMPDYEQKATGMMVTSTKLFNEFLYSEWLTFKVELPERPKYNINSEKVGEDRVFPPSPSKNLFDFIKKNG